VLIGVVEVGTGGEVKELGHSFGFEFGEVIIIGGSGIPLRGSGGGGSSRGGVEVGGGGGGGVGLDLWRRTGGEKKRGKGLLEYQYYCYYYYYYYYPPPLPSPPFLLLLPPYLCHQPLNPLHGQHPVIVRRIPKPPLPCRILRQLLY